ncbi:MAG: hypothetical protein OES47_06130 [Acidobacteriota bacterium]|nr:hypothetical protein [Acidobacteriota bacterium]
MRTLHKITAISLVAVLIALPATADEEREIAGSYEVESLEGVHLDFAVAELRIEGSDGNRIEVELVADCRMLASDCEETLDALFLDDRRHGKSFYLELDGFPRWGKGKIDLEGTIRVPRGLDVDVELGVGELDIEGLSKDLHVELGVGEVNLWLTKSALRSVDLDAGVGEVELHGTDADQRARRSMLVGAEIHWAEGPGKSRVFVEVGVGEVTAWLD